MNRGGKFRLFRPDECQSCWRLADRYALLTFGTIRRFRLTLAQINALPETTACPPEELLS